MKIAIVGSGPNWRECPFGDDSFQIWAYGLLAFQLPRVDLIFEMHMRKYWPRFIDAKPHRPVHTNEEYIEKLNTTKKSIFMAEPGPDLPLSSEYPFEDVVKLVGQHICSSVGYQLAFAALMQDRGDPIEQIVLFGLDLCTYEEWAHQRPNTNRLIGFLQGRGVNVQVPPSSKLFGRPFMYGLEVEEDNVNIAGNMIEEDIMQMSALMYRWADHTYALKLAEAKRSEGG